MVLYLLVSLIHNVLFSIFEKLSANKAQTQDLFIYVMDVMYVMTIYRQVDGHKNSLCAESIYRVYQ